MASVVAGGLFNAIAFAGAGYVFPQIRQKRLRKRNETTRRSYGKIIGRKRKMV